MKKTKPVLVGDRAFREKVRKAVFGHRTRAEEEEKIDVSAMQREIWERLRGYPHCNYCDVALTVSSFSLDHDLPVQRGGEFSSGNLQICCRSCNDRKGMLTGVEYQALRALVAAFPKEVQVDFWQRLRSGGARFGRRKKK